MCYSLWYNAPTMLPAGGRSTRLCNTQSSAPEDGQNNCPKHVLLTGIINNPLLLHLVGCLYYLFHYIILRLAKQSQFNPYPVNVENIVSS